jgi:hypothetical protein
MMKSEHEKFMGSRVKDRVTGATGVVSCVSYYLNGCVRMLIEPAVDKDGKRPDAFYVDVQQLDVVEENVANPKAVKPTGGPPRREAPR